MLTLAEATECEGYYLDTQSGDILRNVKSVPQSCGSEGTRRGGPEGASDLVRFERLERDVTLPLETILRLAEERLGRPLSGRIINRQTAIQPDGGTVTEESVIH